MNRADTSPEVVERLARTYSNIGPRDDDLIAATLRALAAERDALASALRVMGINPDSVINSKEPDA